MDVISALGGGALALVGVFVNARSSVKIANLNKRADSEVARESQLWNEIHDLRNRLEKQECACEEKIKALEDKHEKDIAFFKDQILSLKTVNEGLQSQINTLRRDAGNESYPLS